MKRPTTQSDYTSQDLKDYAEWRYKQELKDLKKIKKQLDDEVTTLDQCEDFREPLSIMELREVIIQLSWGGDGDGYKLYFDDENNLIKMIYYWEDWGVYEEIEITNEEEQKLVQEIYYNYIF